MQALTCALVFGIFTRGGQAAYPTACSAYGTCAGLQGDCCPNNEGVNLACCFSGALQMDANKAEEEAKAVEAKAASETASAKAAGDAAAAEAKKAHDDEEAAEAAAKKIQAQIDDLNAHATAAQKKSNEAAAEATNDASAAAKQALAAGAAAEHAKQVAAEQNKIVTETSAIAEAKQEASTVAKGKADKLNAIAGAATKKLNDAKKSAEESSAAAKLQEDAEEKIVAAKKQEAATIQAAAQEVVEDASKKKAAAEAMLAKIDNAQCSKHSGCTGLAGYCCPTLNTNKMHLGSTKLDGENLGCCGSSEEIVSMATAPAAVNFGVVSMFLSAVGGSAMTAMAFKLSSAKDLTNSPYERLAA